MRTIFTLSDTSINADIYPEKDDWNRVHVSRNKDLGSLKWEKARIDFSGHSSQAIDQVKTTIGLLEAGIALAKIFDLPIFIYTLEYVAPKTIDVETNKYILHIAANDDFMVKSYMEAYKFTIIKKQPWAEYAKEKYKK